MKKKLLSLLLILSLCMTFGAFTVSADSDVPMPKALDDPEVAAQIEAVESSEDFYESGWDSTWRYDTSKRDIFVGTFTQIDLHSAYRIEGIDPDQMKKVGDSCFIGAHLEGGCCDYTTVCLHDDCTWDNPCLKDGCAAPTRGPVDAEQVYFYIPTNPDMTDLQHTPVFVYYIEGECASREDAWNAFVESGLYQLAEEANAYCVVLKRSATNTDEQNLAVYKGIETFVCNSYLSIFQSPVDVATGGMMPGRYVAMGPSYDQRMYIFAEGEDASFVNNVISTDVRRVAAICIAGGAKDSADAEGQLPVPAYIATDDANAIAYYKAVNNTADEPVSEEGGVAHFENPDNDVEQVIVNSTTKELSYDVEKDFWDNIGASTARMCYAVSGHIDFLADVAFDLVRIPAMDVIGITKTTVRNDDRSITAFSEWIEYVPTDLEPDQKYPVIICNHGSGDFPSYEAESLGYIDVAAENDIIIVSLNRRDALDYRAAGTPINPEGMMQDAYQGQEMALLVDYLLERLPIDPGRVFLAGFADGGKAAVRGSLEYAPEKYAGVIFTDTSSAFDDADAFIAWAKENNYDVPVYYQNGSIDTTFAVKEMMQGALGTLIEADEIDVTIYQDMEKDGSNTGEDLNGFQSERLYGVYKTEADLAAALESGEAWQTFLMGKYFTSVKLYKDYAKSGIVAPIDSEESKAALIQINVLENAEHIHFAGTAEMAWEFMQHFSRAEDGALLIDGIDYAAEYTPVAAAGGDSAGGESEGESAEGESADSAGAEEAPAEEAPAEAAPADGESAEGESAEGESADSEGANAAPAEEAPAEGESAEGESAEGESADSEGADAAPAEAAPADGESAEGESESAEGESPAEAAPQG